MDKPILYIDMDGVLVNFQSGIDRLSEELRQEYAGRYDEAPGIFALMEPMPGAIEVIYKLQSDYDIYILSTAPWNNPLAWADKVEWVQKYLPQIGYKRLILSHHKELNRGDFLIDDREVNGAKEFQGELILFGKYHDDWWNIWGYLESKFDEPAHHVPTLVGPDSDPAIKDEEVRCKKNRMESKRPKLISPLQNDAFSEPVLHSVVLSKIDFELPDEVWTAINEGFSYYWNEVVGLGNMLDFYDACDTVYDRVVNSGCFYPFDHIVLIVDVLFDFIAQIPGVILDD
jgi:hypothetical protein